MGTIDVNCSQACSVLFFSTVRFSIFITSLCSGADSPQKEKILGAVFSYVHNIFVACNIVSMHNIFDTK